MGWFGRPLALPAGRFYQQPAPIDRSGPYLRPSRKTNRSAQSGLGQRIRRADAFIDRLRSADLDDTEPLRPPQSHGFLWLIPLVGGWRQTRVGSVL